LTRKLRLISERDEIKLRDNGKAAVPGVAPTLSACPCLDEDFFNHSILGADLERKPAFPSRWRAPGSIRRMPPRVWVRAIWRVRNPFRNPTASV
jgi:hypothetical protein